MKTVPLYGKKAAGRVALVDDTDYAFMMLYRWYVWEVQQPGRRPQGPYAATGYRNEGGKWRTVKMHNLIMDAVIIDHINHDTLNNQRENLRLSTRGQNNCNSRPRLGGTSQFKGVSWNGDTGRWSVGISRKGRRCHVGLFDSEIEAAYAYDAEARKEFGRFAYTNFDGEATQEMREEWAKVTAVLSAQRKSVQYDAVRRWWDDREIVTHVCEFCGGSYESKATVTRYCSSSCHHKAYYVRRRRPLQEEKRNQQVEGRLF